jgi:hypothetical protein
LSGVCNQSRRKSVRQDLRKRLAAVEAVAGPEDDISKMSLDELRAAQDAETRALIAEMGSVDAVVAKMRQYVGEEAAADFAAGADRYR